MKLEAQVVSLELAKKLNELGTKQDCLFVWWKDIDSGQWSIAEKTILAQPFVTEFYLAFTVAELGELLPGERGTFRDDQNGKWKIFIHDVITGSVKKVIAEKTEANARGQMLIYLLENKLITL